MSEEIKVEGLEEVCQLLQVAPKEIVPGALLAALKAWADVMQATVVTFVPIREIRIGGDADYPALIEDLHIEIILDSTFRGGVAKVGFGKQAYVARFVEYGHRQVSHGAKADRKELGSVPEHPFMRPAAADGGEAALDAFVATFRARMEAGGLINAA